MKMLWNIVKVIGWLAFFIICTLFGGFFGFIVASSFLGVWVIISLILKTHWDNVREHKREEKEVDDMLERGYV